MTDQLSDNPHSGNGSTDAGSGPSTGPGVAGEAGECGSLDPRMVRSMIRMSHHRSRLFGPLFADPAWEMMLDLLATKLEGKTILVSALSMTSGFPTATANRLIARLVAEGRLVRTRDPSHRRRIHVSLSKETEDALQDYLLGLS